MTSPTSKPRVAVVFGGRSSEHGISCVTAGSVLAAIDREKYDVVPVGIATDGRWVLESGDTSRLAISGSTLPEVDGDRAGVALLRDQEATDLVVADASTVPEVIGAVDVVFPLLHGPWGEDGTIQGMLEMAGVRYVGAGVLASAVGMDKAYLKVVLRAAGLPVLPGVVVTSREWENDPDDCRRRVAELGYPVFAKPARGGSSFGISKVHDAAELDRAIAVAQEHDPKVLIEAAAPAGSREVECGVLEFPDDTVRASVPAEVRVVGEAEFYDFGAKYLDDVCEFDIPAKLDDDVAENLREMAVAAFRALDGQGLARVDFFVGADGELTVNEVNTMPGFTPTSMYPRMWAVTGIDYPALLTTLIDTALARGTGLR